MAEKRKTLKEQAEKLYGKKPEFDMQEKLNAWLDDNVNQPLAKRGYETAGAGLSAAGSALGELFLPEGPEDVALGMLGPFGKGLSKAKKMLKAGKKGEVAEGTKEIAKAPTFSDIKQPSPKELRKQAKEAKGERTAVAKSKTRESLETLQKDLDEELLKKKKATKAKLAEHDESPVLDYSKMK